MKIINNYKNIESQVKKICEVNKQKPVLILAVSKTFPLEKVLELHEYGVKDFGENYAQELKQKNEEINSLPNHQKYKDIRWHFIGHLQSNKVKYIAEYVYAIHSVDSLKLAQEISKQAIKFGRINNPIKIFLQIHTSNESTKSGLNSNDIFEVVKEVIKLEGVNLIGLMTITALTDATKERIPEFILLKKLLFEINQTLNLNLTELSMGMSDDFEYAIENGSTIVRIGSAIFGERDYSN